MIALARQAQADWLVTDDERLRRVAHARSVPVLHVAEVLWLAKREGMLPEIRPVLDRMRARDFGISDEPYQAVLQRVGE